MGWRDSINQNLAQSNSLTIELSDPKSQYVLPGTVLSGHVVVRPVKPLTVGSLCITLYGISDAHILRQIGTIQNHFFGRGFLFQEIQTVATGPLTLEPIDGGSSAYRYPFSFTVPETTRSMKENTANVINKWKPKPPFLGAEEMHPLPPRLESKGKSPFGFHESTVSYRLDATCEKTKGGTSPMWLPQMAKDVQFFPVRAQQMPDIGSRPLTSQPHSLKSRQQFSFIIELPSIAYPGGPFPLRVGQSGVTGLRLTSLEVKLQGRLVTRGRNILFGDKVAEEKKEVTVANWANLDLPLAPELGTLQATVPQGIIPTFRSFTVALPEYLVLIKYQVNARSEVVKGEIREGSLHILSPISKYGGKSITK
ncbi:hypothetical protein ACLMJK_006588 [Lecanora helva]